MFKNLFDDIHEKFSKLYNNIYYFFVGVTRWFSYCKLLISLFDFDWSSVVCLEQAQLVRLRNTITKNQLHENWERDVYWINTSLALLDIIIEDSIMECWFDDEGKLRTCLKKYVNTRNAKRFISADLKYDTDYLKDGLYVEKAWQLYNKIRTEYMRYWWE